MAGMTACLDYMVPEAKVRQDSINCKKMFNSHKNIILCKEVIGVSNQTLSHHWNYTSLSARRYT